jgi:ribosomal protein S18 acetylase RimI-like enzyme
MKSGVSMEILDLRHFAAPLLRPLLEAEAELWRVRLHWDYRTSAKLLMQYLDSHMLPGYAALEAGKVMGYGFCVYEETKAVIGDVYAFSDLAGAPIGNIPTHGFETLQNSPHVDRIESQLLLHPSGSHRRVFTEAGFEVYRRLFMVQPLVGIRTQPHFDLAPDLELRPWRDDDLNAAGGLISEAYNSHPDSLINDQYRSSHGSLRFLHNIVRYAGCGTFSPQVSYIVLERSTREIVALVLGSRVSPESGHITQLCVRPSHRRRGLGRLLLTVAAAGFVRQGASEISLTVTEANSSAIELYRAEGYECGHEFDAAVWQRGQTE